MKAMLKLNNMNRINMLIAYKNICVSIMEIQCNEQIEVVKNQIHTFDNQFIKEDDVLNICISETLNLSNKLLILLSEKQKQLKTLVFN